MDNNQTCQFNYAINTGSPSYTSVINGPLIGGFLGILVGQEVIYTITRIDSSTLSIEVTIRLKGPFVGAVYQQHFEYSYPAGLVPDITGLDFSKSYLFQFQINSGTAGDTTFVYNEIMEVMLII